MFPRIVGEVQARWLKTCAVTPWLLFCSNAKHAISIPIIRRRTVEAYLTIRAWGVRPRQMVLGVGPGLLRVFDAVHDRETFLTPTRVRAADVAGRLSAKVAFTRTINWPMFPYAASLHDIKLFVERDRRSNVSQSSIAGSLLLNDRRPPSNTHYRE